MSIGSTLILTLLPGFKSLIIHFMFLSSKPDLNIVDVRYISQKFQMVLSMFLIPPQNKHPEAVNVNYSLCLVLPVDYRCL